MSDRELLDALNVIARKAGLLPDGMRFVYEQVPVREEQALCLAFGTYGEVRLCCTYGKEHGGLHSWERAMIGKSACIAATKIGAFGEWLCQRPSGHAGEHKASTPDGARWTWGDAPLCGAKNASQNPVMAGQVCALLRGHEGSHEATVNGQRWPFGRTDPTEPRAS